MTLTCRHEGHHWGLESEKNNYHYPCHEKALQARSYLPWLHYLRVACNKNNVLGRIIMK